MAEIAGPEASVIETWGMRKCCRRCVGEKRLRIQCNRRLMTSISTGAVRRVRVCPVVDSVVGPVCFCCGYGTFGKAGRCSWYRCEVEEKELGEEAGE